MAEIIACRERLNANFGLASVAVRNSAFRLAVWSALPPWRRRSAEIGAKKLRGPAPKGHNNESHAGGENFAQGSPVTIITI